MCGPLTDQRGYVTGKDPVQRNAMRMEEVERRFPFGLHGLVIRLTMLGNLFEIAQGSVRRGVRVTPAASNAGVRRDSQRLGTWSKGRGRLWLRPFAVPHDKRSVLTVAVTAADTALARDAPIRATLSTQLEPRSRRPGFFVSVRK